MKPLIYLLPSRANSSAQMSFLCVDEQERLLKYFQKELKSVHDDKVASPLQDTAFKPIVRNILITIKRHNVQLALNPVTVSIRKAGL